MIDIHSHILYDVDDGPSKIEDSLRMISEAAKVGVKEIVSTTHYHEDLFEPERYMEAYRKLSLRASDFGIKLKNGYEVFISPVNCENYNKISGLTLDNSKYLLIEFPFSVFPTHVIDTIYNLQGMGIIPILAHPERSRFFVENNDLLLSFMESGCLIQVDAASILGVYGRHAKRFVKNLIKSQHVTFVASNAHFADDYSEWYRKAFLKVQNWAGIEYADTVFGRSPKINIKGNNLYSFGTITG